MVRRLRSSSPTHSDDHSVSSTLTVERVANTKSLPPALGKRVTFDVSKNVVHDNDLCKDDCRELWHSNADYKFFKKSTLSAAKAIIQAEAKNNAPFSYERVFVNTFEICRNAVSEDETFDSLSTEDDRRHLNRWLEIAPTRIGMEKWSVRSLSKEKSTRRFEIVDVVLDIQESNTSFDADSEEFIRKSCEAISRPSRLFAAAVGQAQAEAVLKMNAEEEFFS